VESPSLPCLALRLFTTASPSRKDIGLHFKQKLAFFVFGCVFVIVGQVVTGLVVPSATAQSGLQDVEFGTIRARKVIVRYPGGGFGMFKADATSASLDELPSIGV